MLRRSAFHLDCNPMIPECGYRCGKCLQEMRCVFEAIQGVAGFHAEGSGRDAKTVVEYDPCTVTVEDMMKSLRQLPSFYKGFFVPSLLEA